MTKKHKICIVLPTLSKGGLQRVASILANNFIADAAVLIVTLSDDKVENDIDESVKIVHLNTLKSFNKFKLFSQLIPVLKENKPNVVLGFSEIFNPITILSARYCGINVFVSDRSSPVKYLPLRDRVFKKLTYFLANGIISQTVLSKQKLLERKLNKNIAVIANPLSDIKNENLNYKKKRIVTLGRLVKSKNHLELVKIFHEIDAQDWQLVIGGDGSEKATIEDYIREHNLSDKIILEGQVDDIESFFSQGSLFAFTSLSEGFPNALMEGLSFPLATIAYNCPAGVSDLVIDNENGYLIELNNRIEYKKRLIDLMNSEEKRLEFMQRSILLRGKYLQSEISKQYFSFITS